MQVYITNEFHILIPVEYLDVADVLDLLLENINEQRILNSTQIFSQYQSQFKFFTAMMRALYMQLINAIESGPTLIETCVCTGPFWQALEHDFSTFKNIFKKDFEEDFWLPLVVAHQSASPQYQRQINLSNAILLLCCRGHNFLKNSDNGIFLCRLHDNVMQNIVLWIVIYILFTSSIACSVPRSTVPWFVHCRRPGHYCLGFNGLSPGVKICGKRCCSKCQWKIGGKQRPWSGGGCTQFCCYIGMWCG